MPGQENVVVGRENLEDELVRRLEGIRYLGRQELADRMGLFLTQSIELKGGKPLSDASKDSLYAYSLTLAEGLKEDEPERAPRVAARLIRTIKMWWGIPLKENLFEAVYKRLYGTTPATQGEDFARQLFLPFAATGEVDATPQVGPPPDFSVDYAFAANFADSANTDDLDSGQGDAGYANGSSNAPAAMPKAMPKAIAAGLAGVAVLFLLSRR